MPTCYNGSQNKEETQLINDDEEGINDNNNNNEGTNKYEWIERTLKKYDSEWDLCLTNFKQNKLTDKRLEYIPDNMLNEMIPASAVRYEPHRFYFCV